MPRRRRYWWRSRGRLIIVAPGSEGTTLLAAAGVRAFVIGVTGVLLGLYLARSGFEPDAVGLVIGLGLAGNATATALVAGAGARWNPRRALVTLALLSASGLAVLAWSRDLPILCLAALGGLVNGMGRDRGAAFTLEQAVLADGAAPEAYSRIMTRYTAVQDVAGGVGSLAAALPEVLNPADPLGGYRLMFTALAAMSLAPLLGYLRLPAAPPVSRIRPAAPSVRVETRRRVRRLAALFALDSLGGGFLAGSILAYWFFRRFELGAAFTGPLFLAARVLNTLSYFAAEALARRIGLVRTMVFTHLPSSAILLLLPLATTGGVAALLFLVRESLVQMDVPTRQAYLARLTRPGERAYAIGITSLVRNVGWAVGPSGAGAAISRFGLGAPLVVGAGLKMIYDLILYRECRREDVDP